MIAVDAPVRFTDGVLDAIAEHIAAPEPERGAVLLGFGDLVHFAVLDSHGRYSGVSWDISAEVGDAVAGLESAFLGTFAGTVHSHPRGVTDPSGTDIASTATMLRLNPHLDSLVVAIVTAGPPQREHHLGVGDGHRMSLHRVVLVDDEPVVTRVRGEVVALTAPFAAVGRPLDSAVSVSAWRRSGVAALERAPRVAPWRGRECLYAGVGGPARLTLVVPREYPVAGPVLLGRGEAEEVQVQPSPWDPSRPPATQLAALLRSATVSVDERLDRTVPLVGDLRGRTVFLAGAGSVGSRIAEELVRAGVGRLRVLDPDTVEAPNLARSTYAADDVGELKVEALARFLRRIDPAVVVEPVASTIGTAHVPGLLEGSDLVVGATDDMRDQLVLAHHAYAAGVPMVTCALYAGADAGEIVVSLPAADSACVACSLGDGRTINQFRPASDYGLGGRLVSEPGLGASIHVVASMASLVALGVLAGPASSLAPLVAGAVATGRTLAMIATRPGWGFFPEVFGENGHQLAPQSVWVRVERSPDCVVCGDPASRVDPVDAEFAAAFAAARDAILAGEDGGQPPTKRSTSSR